MYFKALSPIKPVIDLPRIKKAYYDYVLFSFTVDSLWFHGSSEGTTMIQWQRGKKSLFTSVNTGLLLVAAKVKRDRRILKDFKQGSI